MTGHGGRSSAPSDSPADSPPRLQIRYVPVDDLTPYARNARKHPDSQIRDLANSIKRFGWGPPLIVHKGTVAAGHARLAAAKLIGMKEVPCVDRSDWTEAEFRAFVLADNKLGTDSEWDMQMLELELTSLAELDESMVEATTFDMKKLAKIVSKERTMNEASDQLPGARELKDDMVFPFDLPWGIPELRRDMLGSLPSSDIRVWIGAKTELSDDCWYIWIMGSGESPAQSLAHRTMTAFYQDDEDFESLWRDPRKQAARMVNVGIKLAVAPNYSMWPQEAEAVHLWNTYRSRWLSRYWQEVGIHVIPDLNWAGPTSFEFSCIGIPSDIPAASVQIQNVKTTAEEIAAIDGLKRATDIVRPQQLMVYAGQRAGAVVAAAGLENIATFVTSRSHAVRAHFNRKREKSNA